MCRCSPSRLLACLVPVCVSKRLQKIRKELNPGIFSVLLLLKYFKTLPCHYFIFKDSCLWGQLATTNSANKCVATDTEMEPSVKWPFTPVAPVCWRMWGMCWVGSSLVLNKRPDWACSRTRLSLLSVKRSDRWLDSLSQLVKENGSLQN